MAAWCISQRKAFSWRTDPTDFADAERLARTGIDLGPDDAVALSWAGQVIAYVVGDASSADLMIDRSLDLNPNLGSAWGWSGWVKLWKGQFTLAIERQAHAIRLSPRDPFLFDMRVCIAHAHFFSRRFNEAVTQATLSLHEKPMHVPALRLRAAANALNGDVPLAQADAQRLLTIDGGYSVARVRKSLGPYSHECLQMYDEGLRIAGVPKH